MSKARLYSRIDFTNIKPEHVQRIVKDLYIGQQNDQRESCFAQSLDRRQADRRRGQQNVLLDTRTSQSRRQSSGRRSRDANPDNNHKVGIDYYV